MRFRILVGASLVMIATVAVFFGLHFQKRTSPVREPSSITVPEQFFVRDLDKDLGESFEDDDFDKERQYINAVADTFLKFIRDVKAQHQSPHTFRGAHAKALACLKGELEIQNQALPPELRVGIFANDQAKFKSWVRVSNSSQDPFSPDNDQNTRGFAVKLLGVAGEKLLPDSQATMDLLTVAAEAFVARDNFNYSDIADGTEGTIGLAWRLGISRLRALLAAVSKAKAEPNPLRLDYFSTVPYRLGSAQGPKKAIKFRIVLCDPASAEKFPAAESGPENLVKNITETMSAVENVCYNYQVQVAGRRDNVEDATMRWRGEYVTIAQLRIHGRDNPAAALAGRNEFCEHLSFNPWRTLDAHRPLGRINRARRATYLMSSTFRRTENHQPLAEPGVDSYEVVP